jgi:hypothetical protein
MGALQDLTIPLLPDRYYHIYNRGNNKQAIFFKEENHRYFLNKYAEKMTGYFQTFAYCLLENHFHLFVKGVSPEILLNRAAQDFDVVNKTFFKDYVSPWLRRIGWDVSAMTIDQTRDLTNFKNCSDIDLTNFKNLLNLYEQHGDTQSNPDLYPLNLAKSSFKEQLCSYVLSERFRGFMLGYAKAVNKQENRTGSLFQKAFRRKYVADDVREKRQVLCYIHHNPIHHFYSYSYESYPWSSYSNYLTQSPTMLCRDEAIRWFGSEEEFIRISQDYKTHKKSFAWIIEEY